MRSFTDSWIKTLKPNNTKRLEYREIGSKGFVLRVTPNGTKSFYTYYKLDRGTARKIKHGDYPALSLAEARLKHLYLREKIDQSIDPYVSKEERKLNALIERRRKEEEEEGNRTINQLVAEYTKDRKEQKVTNAEEVLSYFKKYLLPDYGLFKARDITTSDCRRIMERHKNDIIKTKVQRGEEPISIGHKNTKINLSALFSFGIKQGYLLVNPATPLDPNINKATRKKRRCLSDDEIAMFWWGADRLPAERQTQIAIKLLMALGQRQSQLVRAKKSEFDLKNKLWTAPPSNTKTSEWSLTPLPDIAIELIKEQINIYPPFKSQYLFPSSDFDGHMASGTLTQAFTKGVKKGIFPPKEDKVNHFTLYYTRHTLRSNLSRLGFPKDYAERLLDHSQHSMDKVYDHYPYADELRNMMNAWGDLLSKIVYERGQNVHGITAAS